MASVIRHKVVALPYSETLIVRDEFARVAWRISMMNKKQTRVVNELLGFRR